MTAKNFKRATECGMQHNVARLQNQLKIAEIKFTFMP